MLMCKNRTGAMPSGANDREERGSAVGDTRGRELGTEWGTRVGPGIDGRTAEELPDICLITGPGCASNYCRGRTRPHTRTRTCTPPGATTPVPIIVANPQTMYPTANGVALPAYMSKSFPQSQGVTVSDGFDTDLDGNQLPQSPEHKLHIGVAYTINTSFATITPRVDYAWQDESYAREFNTEGDKIDSWDQVNAQLIATTLDGCWIGSRVRPQPRGRRQRDRQLPDFGCVGFFRSYFVTDPRIYGLAITYNFGTFK